MTWLDYMFLGIGFIVLAIGVLAYFVLCMGMEELFQFILTGPKKAVEQQEPGDGARRSEAAEPSGHQNWKRQVRDETTSR